MGSHADETPELPVFGWMAVQKIGDGITLKQRGDEVLICYAPDWYAWIFRFGVPVVFFAFAFYAFAEHRSWLAAVLPLLTLLVAAMVFQRKVLRINTTNKTLLFYKTVLGRKRPPVSYNFGHGLHCTYENSVKRHGGIRIEYRLCAKKKQGEVELMQFMDDHTYHKLKKALKETTGLSLPVKQIAGSY